jgi:hypothetical protein
MGQDRRAAHAGWNRPQLAPSPVRVGSVTGLEAPTPGSGEKPQPLPTDGGLSRHI